MKFKIGDKVLAYAYDSIGYYRGDDLGNAVEVEILDMKVSNDKNLHIDKNLYMTIDKHKVWKVYMEMELFKTQDEIDNLK